MKWALLLVALVAAANAEDYFKETFDGEADLLCFDKARYDLDGSVFSSQPPGRTGG